VVEDDEVFVFDILLVSEPLDVDVFVVVTDFVLLVDDVDVLLVRGNAV
jgi:hypothetical protein